MSTGFDWDIDTGDEHEVRSSLKYVVDPTRSLWTQEYQTRLEDGPHYDHTPGPPSARSAHAKTEGAEAARKSVRDAGFRKPAKAVHYDRSRREYIPDDDWSMKPDKFTLLTSPDRCDRSILPTSPKKYLDAATAIGWDVRAWVSTGLVSPELYVNDSDSDDESKSEHAAGDVKFDGYLATIFTVEAADKAHKLGFRATFQGRKYEDGRKAPIGSFDYAMIADPAGVPVSMRYDYQPMKLTRGKDDKGRTVETPAGFARRQREAQGMADRLARTMNDGTIWWKTQVAVFAAADLNTWLAEWASFSRTDNRSTL